MKLLNQKSKTKQSSYIYLLVLTFAFLAFILLNKQNLFRRFDPEVVSRYLRSQDILDIEDKIKDRIFISDEEIYIASGYLYVTGSKPTKYNFQHPPFSKYLFGLSSKYLNLPLFPNVIFAGILIFEMFLLGKLVFKSEIVGFIASILIMFDPTFKEVTTYALLDLGQMVFILGFLITSLFYKRQYILQGIFLGLAIASKFYSPMLVFLGLIYLYKLAIKQLTISHELKVLAFAFLVFSICYAKAYPYNIFFHQAKIIRFMLDHNTAVEWGGVIPIFFGGYFLWPILFFANLYVLLKSKFTDPVFIYSLIPIFYTLVLCFQLPFTRYFILILPFLYLSFSSLIVKLLTTYNIRHIL